MKEAAPTPALVTVEVESATAETMQALLRATLEASTDGIAVTDMANRITVYNRRFLELWRIEDSEVPQGVEALVKAVSGQLRDPEGFVSRVAALRADSAPGMDLLEFVDGRLFERHSCPQIVDGAVVGRVWTFRDITDQRRIDEKLREQGEWFRVTLGSIGDAVVTVGTDGRLTFLNPVAEHLTGWRSADALGRSIHEVLVLRDEITGEEAENPVDRALAAGETMAMANHTLLVRHDGSHLPIEDSASPIRDAGGRIVGVVMVFHDVTEKRARARELARSEERFRLVSEAVPSLLWSTDAGGNPDYLNDRWYEYTGQTPETALGEGWLDALHPEDRDRVFQVWERSVKSGETYEISYRLRSAEGDHRWFLARAVPLKDREGRISRWYGSSTDIHEQVITAQALQEESVVTDQLYSVARALSTEQDLSTVVQLITDAGTRISRAQFGAFFYNVENEGGASYTLYALSGVPREHFEKFPMPRATELFGPTFRGEGVIRAADIRLDPRFGRNAPHHGMPAGHLPVVSYLAVPVISRSGEVLGGLFFGHAEPGVFTERDERALLGIAAQAAVAMDAAKTHRSLLHSRALAEGASLAKDQFLAALSHELRTPLTPIIAILSSLREDPELPPSLAEQLEIIERNAELEARLIDDLLDLTRVVTGKLELRPEVMTAGAVIADALRTCQVESRSKGLRLVQDATTEELMAGALLHADRARLTQVLCNLLKNAIKFTPPGGAITLRGHLSPASGTEGQPSQPAAIIEVEDTGAGISPELLPRIFEAFEQGGRATTRRFGGLGLGLAISKAIVEAHGGRLEAFSSGPDEGSLFRLTLPMAAGQEALANAPAPRFTAPGETVASSRPLRVLFVEDHADTAATVTLLLERTGYLVRHAGSVAEALGIAGEMMAEGGIDLVMSDIGLPDGSGLDLMRALKVQHGSLPGIALSGYGMETDLEESRDAGFTTHLIKPVPIAILRRTILEVTAGGGAS